MTEEELVIFDILTRPQHKQTTEKIHEADEAGENLSKLKSNLAEIESGLVQNTTVVAYPTGMTHSALPMWQFIVPR